MPSVLALQHLYVMQNAFGLIKIGRSIDPEHRRLRLQTSEHCRIELVLTLKEQGHCEEACHMQLLDHRLAGEWFDGSNEAIWAIEAVFSPKVAIRWPFELDQKGADEWLDAYWERSSQNWLPLEISRRHGYLRRAEKADWCTDGFAWDIHCMLEYGDAFGGSTRTGPDGETFTVCHVEGREVVVPPLTQDIEAALGLWPADQRPTSWNGSALDCCRAAIEARRAQWRERRADERADRRRAVKAKAGK
jgi:hypothetical protein